MQRRSFLKSVLGGTVALAAPVSTREVQAKGSDPDGPSETVLEHTFELGPTCVIGMRVPVPAGARVRVIILPKEDRSVRAHWIAAQTEGIGSMTLDIPGVSAAPILVRVFEEPTVMDGALSTRDAPFVVEVRSHDSEDDELVLTVEFGKAGNDCCAYNTISSVVPGDDDGVVNFTGRWSSKWFGND